jgi:L-lactate dehydrogenase complex protein LldG
MVDSSARDEVLARIRAANPGGADGAAVAAEWELISREYTRSATRGREAVLELLIDRLLDYDAHVIRVEAGGVRDAVAELLAARGFQRIVIPAGVPGEWLPAGVTFVEDAGLPAAELDRVDGVLTGATLAIAETGTIVLQNAAGQGRRAVSLVPDYHLCVVDGRSVVETVSEAFGRLGATAGLATTFISGPSATADIEMTRIKGVHGPRFLDVILIA